MIEIVGVLGVVAQGGSVDADACIPLVIADMIVEMSFHDQDGFKVPRRSISTQDSTKNLDLQAKRMDVDQGQRE